MEAIVQDDAEIAIPVPPTYRGYLMPRRLWADLRLLGVHAFAIAAIYVTWRWGGRSRGAYTHLIMYALTTALYVFVAFVIRWQEAARPWRYVVNGKSFRVILWHRQGRSWQWHDLVWDKEVISEVEESEWRGLPTLTLRTAAREPKDRRVYVMVYAHEDRERVVGQVLPLLQHSRRRFRHEFWCEQFGPQGTRS